MPQALIDLAIHLIGAFIVYVSEETSSAACDPFATETDQNDPKQAYR